MTEPHYFGFQESRSERALQTACLAPALADLPTRYALLSIIPFSQGHTITSEESDNAVIMHFVWVLRDMFSAERDRVAKNRDWAPFRSRWRTLLNLPDWANDSGWWRHPSGAYLGDSDYVVHPCSRMIGWVSPAIQTRIQRFELHPRDSACISTLIEARKVLNTECDCFIQTPKRLIVIECKDKTSFKAEQEQRQQLLFRCLERLLPRSEPLIYIEISSDTTHMRSAQCWSWPMIQAYLR